MATLWGTDTFVSMPAPLKKHQVPLVDMGAFTFTEHGIAHNLNSSDLEAYVSPSFRPTITTESN